MNDSGVVNRRKRKAALFQQNFTKPPARPDATLFLAHQFGPLVKTTVTMCQETHWSRPRCRGYLKRYNHVCVKTEVLFDESGLVPASKSHNLTCVPRLETTPGRRRRTSSYGSISINSWQAFWIELPEICRHRSCVEGFYFLRYRFNYSSITECKATSISGPP